MQTHFISARIYRQTGYPTNHPLAIDRIGAVEDLCAAMGWTGGDNPVLDSPVADMAQLQRFHAPAYLEAIQRSEALGQVSAEDRLQYNLGTLENPVFPGLWQRAATSVGGSVLAAQLADRGAIAYHPAGGTHHGMPDRASGFCYFNDPVFAILTLLDLGRGDGFFMSIWTPITVTGSRPPLWPIRVS